MNLGGEDSDDLDFGADLDHKEEHNQYGFSNLNINDNHQNQFEESKINAKPGNQILTNY